MESINRFSWKVDNIWIKLTTLLPHHKDNESGNDVVENGNKLQKDLRVFSHTSGDLTNRYGKHNQSQEIGAMILVKTITCLFVMRVKKMR